ncbi:MAG: hypothetical protein ACK5MD_00930 [Flavobacteriales bacterium]
MNKPIQHIKNTPYLFNAKELDEETGETKVMIKVIIVRDGLNAASQPKQKIQPLKNSIKQAITPPMILTRPRF